MRKNLLCTLLIFVLAFSCTGCSSEKENIQIGEPQETITTETASSEPATPSDSEKNAEIAEVPEESEEPSTENIKEEVSETSEELTASETTEAPEENTEVVEIVENEVPSYTFSDLSKTMYATQTVNIRDLPSTDGNKLGGLTANQEVAVTGKCNETGWYRISFENGEAFVSDDYLSEEKVEVQQTVTNTKKSGMSRNAADYRQVTSLSEITLTDGWDTDYAGFCENYKNIEKVAYTYNGVTVLLYDYRMFCHGQEQVIFYDFNGGNMPWWREDVGSLNSRIENGGTPFWSGGSDEMQIKPISDFQVY